MLLTVLLMAGATVSGAYAIAQPPPATIHGHANNAAGLLIQDATVRLTLDHSTDPKTVKWAYTFPVDASGNYKGEGIAPNTYIVVLYAQDKVIDYFTEKTFKSGEDKLLDFDMSRKEAIDRLTPEQKKALEDYKKANASAQAENKKLLGLNDTLKQARADISAGNFDAAAATMTTATQQVPDQPLLWIALGDAQIGIADKAAKAAKSAGQSQSDPEIVQKYTDATVSYKKAVDLNAASKKPSAEVASDAYQQIGRAFARSGNTKDASDAYDQAAKADPSKAGNAYYIEAATLYNLSKMDEAGAAADKAIAADPAKADAYYIKGQVLLQKITVDEKTQKPIAPPGCVDAYQKYLELSPDGSHAADVKAILTEFGEKVKTTYKAPKK